jgi:hypothetical protein
MAIIKGLAENTTQNLKLNICSGADQVLALLPEPAPAEVEDNTQAKRCKQNKDEQAEKPAALEARAKAGEYCLYEPLKELPMD